VHSDQAAAWPLGNIPRSLYDSEGLLSAIILGTAGQVNSRNVKKKAPQGAGGAVGENPVVTLKCKLSVDQVSPAFFQQGQAVGQFSRVSSTSHGGE
jgi:hypothetical protein